MANEPSIYPLCFKPIYQYRLWGGRKLAHVLTTPLPGDGPIGEAWILSDRDDFASEVVNGPLAGTKIGDVLKSYHKPMLGKLAPRFERFPLLLKFLDAREMLSVQVHPADSNTNLLPKGERGKTEAWVVMESEPESHIFAGMKTGTTAEGLRAALTNGTVEDDLASFSPKVGEGVFLEAGTVHALGGGVVVFEVQQNSDVTFRLYDWNRVDEKTGKPRELHIEQAIECTNFERGPVGPVQPTVESEAPVLRDQMFSCEFFELWRYQGDAAFGCGKNDEPRVLVCLSGEATLVHSKGEDKVHGGDVWFIPADIGKCECRPHGEITLLEIAIPID